MAGEDEHFDLERPDTGQLLFSTPKRTAAMLGGILILSFIVGAWFFLRPGAALHGASKLGLAALGLLLLVLAGLNFYIAIVGRSFLIDGKTKLVTKNGERLAGFGGIRSVEVAVGYHPSISFAASTYALSLRLKSGERVPITGMMWKTWRDFASSDTIDESNSNIEDAAQRLDEIADEIGALIGVPVSKGDR